MVSWGLALTKDPIWGIFSLILLIFASSCFRAAKCPSSFWSGGSLLSSCRCLTHLFFSPDTARAGDSSWARTELELTWREKRRQQHPSSLKTLYTLQWVLLPGKGSRSSSISGGACCVQAEICSAVAPSMVWARCAAVVQQFNGLLRASCSEGTICVCPAPVMDVWCMAGCYEPASPPHLRKPS